MGDNINNVLKLMADMEFFFPRGDNLTELIETYSDGELGEEDLLLVSAAGSSRQYEDFLRRHNLK